MPNPLHAPREKVVSKDRHGVLVRLQGLNLDDAGLLAKLRDIGKDVDLARGKAQDTGSAISFNLSHNRITGAGVKILIRFMSLLDLRARRLWLDHNHIGDDGMIAIVALVQNMGTPLEELHISHNRITCDSVRCLFAALSTHGAYPWQARDGHFVPLWLRLEHNAISNSEIAIKEARRQGCRYCYVRTEQSIRCTPSFCLNSTFDSDQTPKVHLVYFDVQTGTSPIEAWSCKSPSTVANLLAQNPFCMKDLEKFSDGLEERYTHKPRTYAESIKIKSVQTLRKGKSRKHSSDDRLDKAELEKALALSVEFEEECGCLAFLNSTEEAESPASQVEDTRVEEEIKPPSPTPWDEEAQKEGELDSESQRGAKVKGRWRCPVLQMQPDTRREKLIKEVFCICDADTNGVLDGQKMKKLVRVIGGFKGSDEEWAVSFTSLCNSYNAKFGLNPSHLQNWLTDVSDDDLSVAVEKMRKEEKERRTLRKKLLQIARLQERGPSNPEEMVKLASEQRLLKELESLERTDNGATSRKPEKHSAEDCAQVSAREPKKDPSVALVEKIQELMLLNPSMGYRSLHAALKQQGPSFVDVGLKKVQKIVQSLNEQIKEQLNEEYDSELSEGYDSEEVW